MNTALISNDNSHDTRFYVSKPNIVKNKNNSKIYFKNLVAAKLSSALINELLSATD